MSSNWGIALAQSLVQSITMVLPILTSGIFLIACIKFRWLEFLNKPIDAGVEIAGHRLLGANKNWRGLIIYVCGGMLVTSLIHMSALNNALIAPVYRSEPLLLGFLWGLSYSLGELVNSFVKRRLNIQPGATSAANFGSKLQRFLDNADGSLATAPFLIFIYKVSWPLLVCSFLFGYLMHVMSEFAMVKLDLKKK